MKHLKNIILAILILLTNGCQIFGGSENVLIKEFYNPRQSMKVIVFEKLGNATTSNSIQLSVERYDYELKISDTGNIFIADEIEGITYSKDSLIQVNWIGNKTVEINYPASVRIFKIEEKFENNVGEVEIKYNSRIED